MEERKKEDEGGGKMIKVEKPGEHQDTRQRVEKEGMIENIRNQTYRIRKRQDQNIIQIHSRFI